MDTTNNYKHYILTTDGVPVLENNFGKWVAWFSTANRHVAYDKVGNTTISTIFLATANSEPPVLWETAVLGGLLDQVRDRCAGHREQAEAMHAAMIERVKRLHYPSDPAS